jgi:uncharacterized protein (TIGR02996 family)
VFDGDPRAQALAQAIDDDPYDVEAYRVLADWLGEQGDPRSQLIGMHLLRERLTDKPKLAHLELRTAELFEQHRAHFLGDLDRYVETPAMSHARRAALRQRFTWRFGFIHSAALAGELAARKEPLDRILEHLLRHPSGRFLVELEVRFAEDARAIPEVLAAHAPRALRSLAMALDAPLGALWPALPRLRRLALDVTAHGELGELALPELREARFTGRVRAAHLAAITAAHLPHLEELEIWFARGEIGEDELAPLLARTDLPALRRLALAELADPDAACRALAASPLVRGLSILELPDTWLNDDGARALAALPPGGLDVLYVRTDWLLPDAMEALGRVAKKVVTR